MNRVKILLIAAITAFSLSATAEAAKPSKAGQKSSTSQRTKTSRSNTQKKARQSERIPSYINDYNEQYIEDEPRPMEPYLNTNIDENSADIIDGKVIDATLVEAPTPAPPAGNDGEKVFETVEQMPVFPGGDTALMEFISNNLRYPKNAQDNGIQGRVTVNFVVKKDGSIGQVKIIRGKDPDLDKEAVRVVKTLPNFIPGTMNGQPVNVWYTLPITFRLQH